jgi:hypothetical protein
MQALRDYASHYADGDKQWIESLEALSLWIDQGGALDESTAQLLVELLFRRSDQLERCRESIDHYLAKLQRFGIPR